MAVRAFNGSSDLINTASGALSTNTFGTFAVIVKRGTTNAWHTFLAFHNSGGDALTQFGYNNSNLVAMWKSVGPDSSTGPAAIPTTAWGLLVYRKATGTATGRFSLYNFATATWTHGAANISMGNWTAPGASGTVRVEWQGGDRLNGRLAARAAWNSLPWTADAAGDAAIVAAGLHTSAANWLAANPSAMWLFNQAAVTTAVEDITGGGADQTSRTGTTVITTDDPPGFDFSTESGTPYGRTTETETARGVTAAKAASAGHAAEQEAARVLAASKTTTTARATETESARAFIPAKLTQLVKAAEVEAARAYTSATSRPYGRSTETETVRGFTATKVTALGHATESESVSALTATTDIIYGHADEAETVRGFSVAKVADLSRAAEVEAARSFTAALEYSYGGASEAEQARGFAAPKTATYGAAVETETARAFAGPQTGDPYPVMLPYDTTMHHITYAERSAITYQEA